MSKPDNMRFVRFDFAYFGCWQFVAWACEKVGIMPNIDASFGDK